MSGLSQKTIDTTRQTPCDVGAAQSLEDTAFKDDLSTDSSVCQIKRGDARQHRPFFTTSLAPGV